MLTLDGVKKFFKQVVQPGPASSGGRSAMDDFLIDLVKNTPAPEVRERDVLPDFFAALKQFGHQDFFARGNYFEPRLPVHEFDRKDRYFQALFSDGDRVLKAAYKEGGKHYWGSLGSFLGQRARGENTDKPPVQSWRNKYDSVEALIATQPVSVQQAFETLFTSCKKYCASVEQVARETSRGSNVQVDRARDGLDEDDAEKLAAALKTIWKAFPELDSRMLDGFEYVMSDDKFIKEDMFPRYHFGGSESRRSDHDIEEKLASARRGETRHGTPQQVVAIAKQYVKTLKDLRDFSPEAAKKCAAVYLTKVFDDGWVQGYDNPMRAMRLKPVTEQIIADITADEKAIKRWAKYIACEDKAVDLRAQIGPLLNGSKENHTTTREEALAHAARAEEYLGFCRKVATGTWFDQRAVRVSSLIRDTEVALRGRKKVPTAKL